MSWWRATLSAGSLVVGLQIFAVATAGADHRSASDHFGVHHSAAHHSASDRSAAHRTSDRFGARQAVAHGFASDRSGAHHSRDHHAASRHGEPPASRAASSSTPSLPRNAHATIVDRSPFGLSIEYPLLERALGSGACPGAALVATLRELGSPSLRIGGDSQDLAGPTAAYHFFIPPSFWSTLGCLARETGMQITVGLNFADAPLADDLTTIAQAEQAVPAAQLSFSLGNEPDLYGISHIFPDEPGVTVPAFRPSPWTAGQYASEWQSRRAALGPIRIEGPDLAGIGWRSEIERLLESDPPNVMDVHAYPTSACAPPLTTTARLLSEHASVGLVEKYDWLSSAARAADRPAIISESNSASCGGKPGVSDTPVAGVWAARYVLAALLAGFQQVRFHSAGGSYDPLVFNAGGTVTLQPLGHALLFLHRWIPLGSRVEPSSRVAGVLAAKVSRSGHSSVILSSFSSKPLVYEVEVAGNARLVRSETLTTASSIEVSASVAVRAHRARLTLVPNTVVAIGTS
jgi:hypothetical protein